MPNTSRTLGGRPKKKKSSNSSSRKKLFFSLNPGCSLEGSWHLNHGFSSVQSLSCGRLSATPYTTAIQASLAITNSQNLLKLISIGQLCHPTISSSFVPFSSCLQSFPASGFFQMSQLIASGGQSIGVSGSISVLPMNTQGWSPLGWIGWISCSPRDSQESSPALQFKSINSSALSFFYSPTFTSWFQLFLNAALWNKIMGRNWFIVWEIFEFTKWLFTWRPLNVSREYCLKFELISHIS